MSTITRELAKLFRKITNSEIDAEGNAHVVLSPADSLLINNARIALASLEAEASGRNPVLAYADSYRDMANQGVESIPVWSVITDLERNIAPLFTAPPAPISVPAAMEMDDNFDSAFEHGKAVGWSACRAAMLKHSEPFIVTSDHRMMEMPQVEAINAVTAMIQGVVYAETPTTMQTAPALDSSPKIAELPSGNSPVIPDGWVACVERMPSAGEQVLAYRPDAPESNDPLIKMATYVGGSAHGHGFDCYCKPTHWMPLPAAPQQEA